MVPSVQTNEAPPTLADGRYVVVRVLGEGAQGETLDAVDKREGRPVAIKRFFVRGAKSWKNVELAEREARVLSGLTHPALPRYVEHFEQDGALCLVMEKMEGESVAKVLRRGGNFSQADVMRFLTQAADVLAYLHGRAPPVIHRDIKPGNVIHRPDGSFALVDFGSVRDSLKPEGGSTIVGTFGYMAPEQFQGRALPASDVYAVGATALAMLTRREPEQLPHQGLGIDVQKALGGHASPELVRVLMRMLEPDPDRRASSIAGLLPELQPAASLPMGGHADMSGSTVPGARFESSDPSRFTGPWDPRREEERAREWSGPWSNLHWGTKAEEIARQMRRRAARAARRAERRAERRGWRRPGPHTTPAAALAFLHFGLTVAEILITVLFRVAAPIALTLLSLILGPRLRRAAAGTSELGARIGEALGRARRVLEEPPEAEPWAAPGDFEETARQRGTRVGSPRVRVEDGAPGASSPAEEEAPVGADRAQRSRR